MTGTVTQERRSREPLMRRMLEVQEEERRRIARELHDETGQALTSLLVGLRALEDAPDMTQVRREARRLREMGAELVHNLTRLARGLHPAVLDDLGLVAALQRMAADLTMDGLRVTVKSSGDDHRLSDAAELTAYRIAQEACSNGIRSGKATVVEIEVNFRGNEILLRVSDNGIGFDVERERHAARQEGHLGLVSMEERASLLGGQLTITSGAAGTTVEATIPLASPEV